MNLQPDDSDEPDVNLTPLIDVVFLLLIFFMVSTTFEHQSRIQVELPEASAEPTTPEAESLEIIVDAQGRYFIGDEQVVNSQLKTLKGAIANVLGDRTDIPVIVRADANSPHQSVVTVLDATSQLGLTRISLATTRSTSE
ncbi:MAG: biopolymer transporter ExbD [Gammaproteobacteria bacterium]|nr:biopolymer transporter ExbD [Gammaproteobacteria bacterium]MDH5513842.1 biopolymer transporter ExbD [Gammaproteobacteria bacterium]